MQRKPQPHMIALCWFREEGSLPVIFYRNPVILSGEEVREALYAMRYLGPLTSHQISRLGLKRRAERLEELTLVAQALFESLERIMRGVGQARETLEKLLLLPEPQSERTALEDELREKGLGKLLAAFNEERKKSLTKALEKQPA